MMRLALYLVVPLLVAVSGCGSDSGPAPVCGNGVVERGEQCDRGADNGKPGVACDANCKSISVLIPQVSVSWQILGNTGVADYKSAGCTDVDSPWARVILDGPSPGDEVLECGRHSKIYARLCPKGSPAPDGGECPLLAAGMYGASVQLLKDDMTTPVTRVVSTAKVDVQPGKMMALVVSFEMADFIKQDYTGALDFHASWGAKGVGCAAATPPVTGESLRLVRDGQTMPVMGMADPLHTKLDGTTGMCFTSDNMSNTSEGVTNLLWGKYNLTIKSADSAYVGTFPLFVGPNKSPQTYELVVLPPLPPDMSVVNDLTSPPDAASAEMSAIADGGAGDAPMGG